MDMSKDDILNSLKAKQKRAMQQVRDTLKKRDFLPQANATLPDAILETQILEQKIKKPPYLTFPVDLFEGMRRISTLYKLSKKDRIKLQDGSMDLEKITYRKALAQGQMEFHFTKDIIPNLSLMGRALGYTLHFAIKQNTWRPTFTLGEKAKELGYSDKEMGKMWKELHNAEMALVNGRYAIINNKKGKQSIKHYGSLYADLEIRGEGKGRTYTAFINPLYLKAVVNPDEIYTERYIKYPYHLLSDRTIGHQERNFLNWLLWTQNLGTPIRVEKLLKETLNLSKQYYERKEYCLELLDRCLALARRENIVISINNKEEGNKTYIDLLAKYGLSKVKEILQDQLKDKKITELLGDSRKWVLTVGSRATRKGRAYTLTDQDNVLLDKMLDWGFDKFARFGIRNPRELVRKQLASFIVVLGGKAVGLLYNNASKVGFRYSRGKKINAWAGFWNDLQQAKKDTKKGNPIKFDNM